MKIATILKVAKVGIKVAKPAWEMGSEVVKKVVKKKPSKAKKAVKAVIKKAKGKKK